MQAIVDNKSIELLEYNISRNLPQFDISPYGSFITSQPNYETDVEIVIDIDNFKKISIYDNINKIIIPINNISEYIFEQVYVESISNYNNDEIKINFKSRIHNISENENKIIKEKIKRIKNYSTTSSSSNNPS